MRRAAGFQAALICAGLSMVVAVLAAALITSRAATQRGTLDRTLATFAGEKATLVETELEQAQALALVTARVPPFSELYADAGSLASRIAAVARPHREIDDALRYVWQLYPSRFVEMGYVDVSGHEDARIVRGEVTPLSKLSPDVSGWPSFWQGVTTPPGSAWITEPFISPTAHVPVVAATTAVSVDGHVRAFVELELALQALHQVLAEDVDLHKVGVSVVSSDGALITRVGPVLGGGAPRVGLSTARGWRVAVHQMPSTATPEPWFVVVSSRAPSALDAVTPAEIAMILLAAALFLLAAQAWRRARSAAAQRLEEEQHARADAEQRSRVDPLTGLFNRRHAMETIEHELARSGRDGSRLGLLMFDIDRFKQINDRHGHAGGDAVLVEVARRLRAGVRVYDTVARVGGEEFCVVIPGVAGENVVAELGERLRQSIAERAMVLGSGIALPVTVSVGAAMLEPGAGSAEHAVDCADRALYSAKRRGRNRLSRFSALDREDVRAEEPECLHTAEALAIVQDVREGMPADHSRRIAEISGAVARRLGLAEDETLSARLGGWLHDIGKVAVPDAILGKRGSLTDAEWAQMRAHAATGEELVRHFPELSLAAKAVRGHHERYDGTGYPDGKAGEQIPLEARIVAAVDAYASMTVPRPYRSARSEADARAELRRCAGTQLDPRVVEALLEELSERVAAPAGEAGSVQSGR